MLIAQISDTHIKTPGRLAYGQVDTSTALTACLAHLARQDTQPDLVLFTGDLADFGTPDEYAHFKQLLAPLGLPVYLLPGNHDDREAMRAAWPDAPWARRPGRLHSVIENWPIRIICLDTLRPGSGGGHLDPEDLAWLDSTLAEKPGQPTIVAMHHPPFLCGVTHMDAISLDNAPDFAAVVARHPHIQRILCGHLHRPIHAQVGGRPVVSAPSPAHQVALDLAPDAPSRFIMEPPGYLLHLWVPRSGLVTHTMVIGDYGARHPFFKDGSLID
ncbi:phosphodiesterase [Telmatospirillum siberiense]|uniref:Phosphodiesterase n=1 Tax=Telmatospirillum siberiense TaxID=382514 RepID=A0A2N3PX96_9PROT|nr:phosphodiesterase [Telmatospirillum siberiense]PKU25033.1 phosphodiesterase [Telmatospirillum siberiense]